MKKKEVAEMKRDKAWLKKEINKVTSRIYGADFNTIKETDDLIDQLDESEVTLDRAFEKVAESYPMTKEEIWRHLERLVAHGGKVTYGEPKVLSQEWIDENEQCITGHGADKNGMSQYHHAPFVSVYDLQNLLVPKQNKPVIPQFVADWIEQQKQYGNEPVFISMKRLINQAPQNVGNWFDNNLDLYARAWLDGYEVEKEKRYYIIDKTNNSTLMTFELSDVVGEEVIEFVYGYSENETIHFNSKEKAEVIAHFVGESLEVEEVTE